MKNRRIEFTETIRIWGYSWYNIDSTNVLLLFSHLWTDKEGRRRHNHGTMAEDIPVTHIVLFKYKPDLTWTDFEEHFETFMALKEKSLSPKTGKPLIKSLKAGQPTYFGIRTTRLTHYNRQESIMGTIQQRHDTRFRAGVPEPRRSRLLPHPRTSPSRVFEECRPVDVCMPARTRSALTNVSPAKTHWSLIFETECSLVLQQSDHSDRANTTAHAIVVLCRGLRSSARPSMSCVIAGHANYWVADHTAAIRSYRRTT